MPDAMTPEMQHQEHAKSQETATTSIAALASQAKRIQDINSTSQSAELDPLTPAAFATEIKIDDVRESSEWPEFEEAILKEHGQMANRRLTEVDDDELTDAEDAATTGLARLTAAFPGAEVIEPQ